MYTFPELLKKIREESGLTQEQFSHVLDVSAILISMVETGQKPVSKSLILKLADKLEIHPNSLTPFLFLDPKFEASKVSKIEKLLIDFGEKMQRYLLEKKVKNLKKYA